LQVAGVVLADQVKSMDWQVREIEFIDKAPNPVIQDVSGKIKALLP